MDQQELGFATKTEVLYCGSRWFGQEPASVDELLDVIAAEPLSRTFEIYGNFIIADGEGSTRFWGNFAAISHVFCIDTNDPEIIERLTKAIRANQQTAAYLAQPVPRAAAALHPLHLERWWRAREGLRPALTCWSTVRPRPDTPTAHTSEVEAASRGKGGMTR